MAGRGGEATGNSTGGLPLMARKTSALREGRWWECRELGEVSEEDAVRSVLETWAPIAQEAGASASTRARWRGRCRGSARAGGVGRPNQDYRAEPVRPRRENADLRMQRGLLRTSGGPLGRRCDEPVAVAVSIAPDRKRRDGRHTIACRAAGGAGRGPARRYTAPP